MQQGMHMGNISQNTIVLELAAALDENTAIQQEIILNSHRRFHLEVRRRCLSFHMTLHSVNSCKLLEKEPLAIVVLCMA